MVVASRAVEPLDAERPVQCHRLVGKCQVQPERRRGRQVTAMLMVLNMGSTGEVDAAGRIHQILPKRPVVALTAHRDRREVLDCFDAGMIGYVVRGPKTNVLLLLGLSRGHYEDVPARDRLIVGSTLRCAVVTLAPTQSGCSPSPIVSVLSRFGGA